MKYLFIILFIITGSSALAQSIRVTDAATKKPVPFATILLKNAGKAISGFYTAEDGSAIIPQTDFEIAEFSCLGYETQSISKNAITETISITPKAIELDEVAISGRKLKDSLIGEYKEKRSKKQVIAIENTLAVFFENTFGKEMPIKAVWLKLAKIKYTTAIRIHIYKRRDYVQEYWSMDDAGKTVKSYESYIPDTDIYEENIIAYIKPAGGKEAKIDLSEYNLFLPKEGAYIGFEVVGNFDAAGAPVKTTSPKELTWIETHNALNHNFAQKLGLTSLFWVNINRWLLNDYTNALHSTPPHDVFQTPTVGIVVGY